MTDDSEPQDDDALCIDYRGFAVYPEDVDAVPIEELEALADEMDKYGSSDVDRFTAKLNHIIQEYRGASDE